MHLIFNILILLFQGQSTIAQSTINFIDHSKNNTSDDNPYIILDTVFYEGEKAKKIVYGINNRNIIPSLSLKWSVGVSLENGGSIIRISNYFIPYLYSQLQHKEKDWAAAVLLYKISEQQYLRDFAAAILASQKDKELAITTWRTHQKSVDIQWFLQNFAILKDSLPSTIPTTSLENSQKKPSYWEWWVFGIIACFLGLWWKFRVQKRIN